MKMTGGLPAVGHCGLLSWSREETKIPAKPAICHWHSLTTGGTAQEWEEPGNANSVFVPTFNLMLRIGKREKTAGRRWAAKQTVPGQDVVFGMCLQQDGPFPGDETGLWRRA